MLRGVNPPPNLFGHSNIGINVAKHRVHLIEFVGIARRSTEFDTLRFTRADAAAEQGWSPRLGQLRLALQPPNRRRVRQEPDHPVAFPVAFSSARAASHPS